MTIDRTEAQHTLRRAAVRCAIYTRKSTEEGLEQDPSIRSMRSAMRPKRIISSQTARGMDRPAGDV